MQTDLGKNHALLREVISQHHPDFIDSVDLKRFAEQFPDMFDVPKLIEHTLAHVGGYDFVDEGGRDFNDPWNSDSKTATVIQDGRSLTAVISSVENKIGSLRITVYNPFAGRVDYFYIPKRWVDRAKERCYGKSSYKEKLRIRYNQRGDHYNWFEDFRVDNFETLARTGDDCWQ